MSTITMRSSQVLGPESPEVAVGRLVGEREPGQREPVAERLEGDADPLRRRAHRMFGWWQRSSPPVAHEQLFH